MHGIKNYAQIFRDTFRNVIYVYKPVASVTGQHLFYYTYIVVKLQSFFY